MPDIRIKLGKVSLELLGEQQYLCALPNLVKDRFGDQLSQAVQECLALAIGPAGPKVEIRDFPPHAKPPSVRVNVLLRSRSHPASEHEGAHTSLSGQAT